MNLVIAKYGDYGTCLFFFFFFDRDASNFYYLI